MAILSVVPAVMATPFASQAVAKRSALPLSPAAGGPSLESMTRVTTLLVVELLSFFITVDPLSWEFVHVADNGYAPSSIVLILFALSLDNAMRQGLLRKQSPTQQRVMLERMAELQQRFPELCIGPTSESCIPFHQLTWQDPLCTQYPAPASKIASPFDFGRTDLALLDFKVPRLEFAAPLLLLPAPASAPKPVEQPEIPLFFPEEIDEAFTPTFSTQEELLAQIPEIPDAYMIGGFSGFVAAQCINNRSRRRRRRTRRRAAHAASDCERMRQLRELFSFAPNVEIEDTNLSLDDVINSVVSQFFEMAELSPEVLLTTVVYLKRLQAVGGLCLLEENWCLSVVTAATLAQKWVDDVCYTVGDICEQLPLYSAGILRENEIAAVQLLNWDLRVSQEELHAAWADVEGDDYLSTYVFEQE